MDIYIRFGGDLVVYVRFMFPVVPHSFAECINYSLRLLSIDTMDVLQFLAKLASNKRIKNLVDHIAIGIKSSAHTNVIFP